jgi:hypothetical protein
MDRHVKPLAAAKGDEVKTCPGLPRRFARGLARGAKTSAKSCGSQGEALLMLPRISAAEQRPAHAIGRRFIQRTKP